MGTPTPMASAREHPASASSASVAQPLAATSAPPSVPLRASLAAPAQMALTPTASRSAAGTAPAKLGGAALAAPPPPLPPYLQEVLTTAAAAVAGSATGLVMGTQLAGSGAPSGLATAVVAGVGSGANTQLGRPLGHVVARLSLAELHRDAQAAAAAALGLAAPSVPSATASAGATGGTGAGSAADILAAGGLTGGSGGNSNGSASISSTAAAFRLWQRDPAEFFRAVLGAHMQATLRGPSGAHDAAVDAFCRGYRAAAYGDLYVIVEDAIRALRGAALVAGAGLDGAGDDDTMAVVPSSSAMATSGSKALERSSPATCCHLVFPNEGNGGVGGGNGGAGGDGSTTCDATPLLAGGRLAPATTASAAVAPRIITESLTLSPASTPPSPHAAPRCTNEPSSAGTSGGGSSGGGVTTATAPTPVPPSPSAAFPPTLSGAPLIAVVSSPSSATQLSTKVTLAGHPTTSASLPAAAAARPTPRSLPAPAAVPRLPTRVIDQIFAYLLLGLVAAAEWVFASLPARALAALHALSRNDAPAPVFLQLLRRRVVTATAVECTDAVPDPTRATDLNAAEAIGTPTPLQQTRLLLDLRVVHAFATSARGLAEATEPARLLHFGDPQRDRADTLRDILRRFHAAALLAGRGDAETAAAIATSECKAAVGAGVVPPEATSSRRFLRALIEHYASDLTAASLPPATPTSVTPATPAPPPPSSTDGESASPAPDVMGPPNRVVASLQRAGRGHAIRTACGGVRRSSGFAPLTVFVERLAGGRSAPTKEERIAQQAILEHAHVLLELECASPPCRKARRREDESESEDEGESKAVLEVDKD